jgi:hypothetical protein
VWVVWERDRVAAARSAAVETVAEWRRRAAGQRMAVERGAGLAAWWRADPSDDRDLDLAQFFEIIGRCAEILLGRLDGAVVVRVRPETVLRISPVNALEEVCRVGVSVRPPAPAVLFDFEDAPGAGVPLPAFVPVEPPPVMVAALCAKRECGPLSLMPVLGNGARQPCAWGELVFDETRELDEPFLVHPGLSVYGRPGLGLFRPPIDMFGSDSLCSAVFRATHLMGHRLLGVLAAIEDGRAAIVDDELRLR